jgi:PAS domain S-box-containing protein
MGPHRLLRRLWNRLSLPAKVGLPLVTVTLLVALGAGAFEIRQAREELRRLPRTEAAREAAVIRLEGRVIMLAGAAAVIEVAALAGLLYLLVHRRVQRLTEAAARVAAGDLTVRVQEGSGEPSRDGLTRLAQALDAMAGTVDARTRELQDAETRYRNLLEDIPAAAYVWGIDDDRPIYISRQVEEMLGFTVDEWLEDTRLWYRMLHPDDRDRLEGVFSRAEASGEPVDEEYRLVAKDGSIRWVHERAVVVQEHPTGRRLLHGVMDDVTDRKAVEEALTHSEEEYRSFVETTKEWVWAMDASGRLTYSNPTVQHILGYAPEELFGRDCLDLVHDEDRQDVVASLTDFAAEGRGWTEWVIRWRHKDGGYRSLESNAVPIMGPAGEVVGFRGSDRDITDRVQAERELRDSVELLRQTTRQRQLLLARLQDAQEQERQRIAEDIHDDSLQVMTALGLRLDAMYMSSTDDRQRQDLERLAETVRQCIRRLRHLLFELRPTVLDRHGLAAALHLHLEEMETESGLQTALENRLIEEPPDGIRTTLYRIAQEALTNVRKHSQAGKVEILLESREGGVFVRVQDNGRGFAPPMDRDAGPGHLGLSAMKERAEMADGWCRVTSLPEGGTTVEFWIPLGHQPAAAARA